MIFFFLIGLGDIKFFLILDKFIFYIMIVLNFFILKE